jgi:hypothetical protein
VVVTEETHDINKITDTIYSFGVPAAEAVFEQESITWYTKATIYCFHQGATTNGGLFVSALFFRGMLWKIMRQTKRKGHEGSLTRRPTSS